MNHPHEKWERVNAHNHCPICDSDHWCTVSPDRQAVRCKKVESQNPSPGNDGDAWIHKVGENGRIFFPKPRRKPPGSNGMAARNPPSAPTPDLTTKHQQFFLAITPELQQELASTLGVDVMAVAVYEVGWDEAQQSWTFPMRDSMGKVIGIKLRDRHGNKKAIPGSKLGLFRQPSDENLSQKMICEGESDTLAGASKGYNCAGVPGAGNCAALAAEWCRGEEVVVMQDNDEAGKAGAETIAIECAKTSPVVRLAAPPQGFKDLRAWVNNGAGQEEIDRVIGEARPSSQGPVGDNWHEIPDGLLSTPPKPRKWLLRHPDRDRVHVTDRHGDGLLPLGKAGLLVSAGGVGKTKVLIALAASIITGRKWLGHFDVDEEIDGDVLLALAEEDFEEIHRRLYDVCEALKLTEVERRLVERKLVVLPLAGIQCSMATKGMAGEIQATQMVDDILKRMQGRKWSLVVLDPLARLAGVPIDVDNLNATFVVTQCERIAVTGPTVVIAHHSSKLSRRLGKAEGRGASAIEDGVRWVATLVESGDHVVFQQTKSNYSRPMPDKHAIRLVRDSGILRAETPSEKEVLDQQAASEEEAVIAKNMELVLKNLRKLGSTSTMDDACSGCGVEITAARVAFRRANTAKKIVNKGTKRAPQFEVAI